MLLKTDFMYINPMVPAFILACLAMSSAYAESIPCNTAKNIAQSKILCAKALEKSRHSLNEKYLTAYLVTDAPIRLIEDTQQLWLNQIMQCKSQSCFQKQFELRLDDLNFYTSMNQSLTQHYVKYENGRMVEPAVQLQVHLLSKDRIKIEGIANRNPNNRAESQSVSLLAYTSPEKKNEITDNNQKCKYQMNFQNALLVMKTQQTGCGHFTGIYRLYD